MVSAASAKSLFVTTMGDFYDADFTIVPDIQHISTTALLPALFGSTAD